MIDLRCEYLSLKCTWLYLFVMPLTNFSLNPQSLVPSLLTFSLLERGAKSEVKATAISLEQIIILFLNRHSTNWLKARNDSAEMWVLIFTLHMTVLFFHVTYEFQVKSTIFSCVNVEHLVVRNTSENLSLSKCNKSRTHNHLGPKQTLNHLIKVTKWLSWDVSTYLYNAVHWMFLSSHVRMSGYLNNL